MGKIASEYLSQLEKDNALPPETLGRLRGGGDILSVFWELKTLLYGGVLLLSSGLGILVYKNIDTIGHTAILCVIGLVTLSGYVFCFRKNPPFTWEQSNAPGILFDYILLLAALCLLIFIGYLQYQYQVFGTRYGLATFIPMILLFLSAYYFDHIGVLSLAITNLAAWAGIVVTPTKMLAENDFSDTRLIYTGIALGGFLLLLEVMGRVRKRKAHFSFTYENFGVHLLYISLLAGMFQFEAYDYLWLVAVLATSFYVYQSARQRRSFYFLLVLTLYTFISTTVVLARVASRMNFLQTVMQYVTLSYLLISSVALVNFLIRQNKKFKK